MVFDGLGHVNDGDATESLLRRSCVAQLRRAHSARRVSGSVALILRVASERRDAQNERDEARAAQLRRSSVSVAAAAPSQQHYNLNLALNWSSHRRDARGLFF